ncbi:MAG: hypothetical protein A2086_04730 [Spirochaetes bacterium GWD1_27_9]|nr:MAG: hypothetical protein A2Z98_17645 [Spirochaetes bacterium GWB1_27_13]OHD25388.1 MAG: hypothetical protein A2Y34_11005 [Spirochaetes bacterium GWC1_27_15]OHD30293.1 MAG: hypothetical protein A2086_04730 [Spirochaetes bacterium GWD1_27_9]
MQQFDTPILFLIFNRPDTTQVVFNEIKKIQPKYLYVAADGHRSHKEGEKEKCDQTRDIVKQVDWDCEIKTLFRDKNLGCKLAVSGAITWFFENVTEGIILEDDCVPNQSFFTFCKVLLEYYRNDTRVMQIGGVNFQDGISRSDGTYFFSRKNHIWGWASWRRAWQNYDVNLKTFPKFREQNQIANIFRNKRMQENTMSKLQQVYDNKIDTWDFQWEYTVLSQNGLVILPNVNMVSNIGFREDATHTKGFDKNAANKKTFEISKIIHPSFVICNEDADEYIFNKEYPDEPFIKKLEIKVKRKIKKILGRI